MLNFVFTIDGDWGEYFCPNLSEEQRKPKKDVVLDLVKREIALAKTIDNKFLHFVHSSDRARDFFLEPEFISIWKDVEKNGGSIGVHCHEDDPEKASFTEDEARMKREIGALTGKLRKSGLHPIAYRGGYLAFNAKLIPILENNNLYLDFSCEPDRYISGAADWRDSPDNVYRMGWDDHRRVGESKVYEVPLGWGMYLELTSLWHTFQSARRWRARAENEEVIVSVLAHTYDFSSWWMRIKLRLALTILKRYGTFINADEVYALVTGASE
ncbi:MAG: hypothetical protein U9R38_06995 [Candidatus Margulisiibacteriota bacterium]|nr:hypothetical protein [Candidatus Margulisiibacteriota bacterium]